MPTEPELLKAVLANPDDDGPRLAYAEWCSLQAESGQKARANFIRCQISLEQPPGASDRRLAYRFSQDGDDLKKVHGRHWDPAVAALSKAVFYHRGFIELVTMGAHDFLAHGERLFMLAPVRHLDLTGVKAVAATLFASPLLRKLRSLSLADCDLGDREAAQLAASPHLQELRWLSLARNDIGPDGADRIAGARKALPRLSYAGFAGNRIEPNEEYSFDNGMVVDAGLPEAGRDLELRHGELRWLRHAATSIDDLVPNRFRIKPAV